MSTTTTTTRRLSFLMTSSPPHARTISHLSLPLQIKQGKLCLETDFNSSEDELHETSVGVNDVLNVLLARGVEVSWITKLHGVSVDLGELLVTLPAAERPVVGRAGGRVETNGLLRDVFAASNRNHGIGGAVGCDADVVPVLLVNVLLVQVVLDDTALAVVSRVEQVLLRVVGLINVVTP